MNTKEYKEAVKERLERLEAEKGIRILYAAVVGSRAYGLESESSDCDTKFIYVHPLNRYLDVDAPEEYLSAGDDVNGYDLRKFLQIARKSGFNTFEMLFSPEVVICADDELVGNLRLGCSFYANPRKMCISYTACMKRSKTCFDKAEDEAAMVKHAVSAARLYLSAYVCHRTQVLPPVVFDELVNKACYMLDREEREFAEELRKFANAKRNGIGAPGVREFMDKVMGYGDALAEVVLDEDEKTCSARFEADRYLNRLFKEIIFSQEVIGRNIEHK